MDREDISGFHIVVMLIIVGLGTLTIWSFWSNFQAGLNLTSANIKSSGLLLQGEFMFLDSEDLPVSSVDWGNVTLGETASSTFVIYNTGDFPYDLSLQAANWEPANASQFLDLSWNYTGERLDLYEKLPVQVFLTVSNETEGISDFSFDIVVAGTEVRE